MEKEQKGAAFVIRQRYLCTISCRQIKSRGIRPDLDHLLPPQAVKSSAKTSKAGPRQRKWVMSETPEYSPTMTQLYPFCLIFNQSEKTGSVK
jgi:hypothetical protein